MKDKKSSSKRSFTIKERFSYWFDNRMTKGSLGLIRVLIVVSVVLAVFIAGLIILFKFNEEGEVASVFWDSIATVINAWMPSFEDGGLGYLILMSLTAIAGVLFTSVLIGIITSAIEEKIDNLKRGNSQVLERGHIVLLGFYPGEYTLLQQLVLSAGGEPACVVVAEDMEREEIEQNIRENLDVPKNFRIVCRTVDITDPASLEKCSLETCKTVIVSPTDDMKTIKTVLAASALLERKGVPEISINAIVSKKEHGFPASLAEANNITTLQTNSIIAKMIAHSCTQTGLSAVFREVFNFVGAEFYLIDVKGIGGLSFEDVLLRLNYATPVGISRNGIMILNPPAEYVIQETDKVLVLTEESNLLKLEDPILDTRSVTDISHSCLSDKTDAVIIEHNETLPLILQELPENVSCVHIVDNNTPEKLKADLERKASERGFTLNFFQGDPQSEEVLLEITQKAEHIVILNYHEQDPEYSDMYSVFLLLKLRDIRKRYNLSFNITVEMQKENNQNLVSCGDHTDFLVSSSMSSLILAQLAEDPELISVFREILSNEGNELFLKNVGSLKLEGDRTVRDLRYLMKKRGYILLGDMDEDKKCYFNRKLDERITLSENDCLIVIGEE